MKVNSVSLPFILLKVLCDQFSFYISAIWENFLSQTLATVIVDYIEMINVIRLNDIDILQ